MGRQASKRMSAIAQCRWLVIRFRSVFLHLSISYGRK
jgi:hypothetical protein